MRRTRFGRLLAVALVVGWLAPLANAQETKSARGTVTALGPSSITVKAGESNLTFAVDPKTVLTASGAGTADRAAEAAGKAGPRLSDFVKVGDNVSVSYTEAAGAMRASRIQKVNSAGSGGGGSSTDSCGDDAERHGHGDRRVDADDLGHRRRRQHVHAVLHREPRDQGGRGRRRHGGGGGRRRRRHHQRGRASAIRCRSPTGRRGRRLHAEQVRVTAKKK